MKKHSHWEGERGHEVRTAFVVVLTFVTMVVEVVAGYWTHSMALLADGFHMLSHVLALGLSWLAYYVARKYSKSEKYSFSREKLYTLSGYTSAIILLFIAVAMAVQSVGRLLNPVEIRFGEAILVAVAGLVVNIVSAVALHHQEDHSDHNIRSAYLHVLADALTSVTAILALTAGKYFSLFWLDAVSGLLSAVVITEWSAGLISNTGKELVNFKRTEK